MTSIDLGSRVSSRSIENLIEPSSSSLLSDGASKLPPFDRALGTQRLCFIGLAFSYLASLGLVVGGAWLFHSAEQKLTPVEVELGYGSDPVLVIGTIPSAYRELLGFIFNASVTVFTDCLGYIHATSLRWSLYHEGRLHHNSNLRLFTSSRNSIPNSWYMNAFWVILLVISQSCASQVLFGFSWVYDDDDIDNRYNMNSLAIILLGISLFLLSLLSTWSLYPTHRTHIISWSPDPLNAALALRSTSPSNPTTYDLPASLPKRRQPSSITTSGSITAILICLWSLAISCAIVAITWSASMSTSTLNYTFTYLFRPDNTFRSKLAATAVNLFVLAGLQILYVLALHSTEQLVNLARDEAAWRRVGSDKGAVVGGSSLLRFATSWEALLLLATKALSHWAFGLTIGLDKTHAVIFGRLPFLILMATAIELALFGTFLAYKRPKGPQPALYGHLKGLGQLVDEWGKGADGRIYWGDKGEIEGQGGIRLAGTSPHPEGVTQVKFDGREYRGLVPDIELRKRKVWSFPRSFSRIFQKKMSEKEKGEEEGLA